jgi:glutathione S-transferase
MSLKLYYASGACSLSPHIALRELGLDFKLEKVDFSTKKTESGADFLKISPNGYVPALEIAPGDVITEGVAILQYLSSLKPGNDLAPPVGSRQHFHLLQWLNFLTSEIHKGFGPLFAGPNPAAQERLEKRLSYVAEQLQGKEFLLGKFGLADAYLFTTLRWADHVKLDLSKFKGLVEYRDRVAARPRVQEALEAEGLLQKV